MITDVTNFDVNKVCFMDSEDATMKGGSVSFKSVPIGCYERTEAKTPLLRHEQVLFVGASGPM